MAYLEGRVIGLDAVAEQRPNYGKQGLAVAHENIHFKGVVNAGIPTATTPYNTMISDRLAVQDLSEDLLQLVLDFDRQRVLAPREPLMHAWLTAPGHISRVVLDEDRKEVLGHGVLRPCHEGTRVAPLNADSPGVAEMLFWSLAAENPPETTLILDVPDPNVDGKLLAQRVGLNKMKNVAYVSRPAAELTRGSCFWDNELRGSLMTSLRCFV